MSTSPEPDPRFAKEFYLREEQFDVVMLKSGVQSFEAKPADFRRVSLTASEPSKARAHADVAKLEAEGFRVLQVVGPGIRTLEEQGAYQRDHQISRTEMEDPGAIDPKGSRDEHGRRYSSLDVVMTKIGTSSLSAKPADFRRVPVMAVDASGAREHEDVRKAEADGYSVSQIVGPGIKTQDEHNAELREYHEQMGPPRRD